MTNQYKKNNKLKLEVDVTFTGVQKKDLIDSYDVTCMHFTGYGSYRIQDTRDQRSKQYSY